MSACTGKARKGYPCLFLLLFFSKTRIGKLSVRGQIVNISGFSGHLSLAAPTLTPLLQSKSSQGQRITWLDSNKALLEKTDGWPDGVHEIQFADPGSRGCPECKMGDRF